MHSKRKFDLLEGFSAFASFISCAWISAVDSNAFPEEFAREHAENFVRQSDENDIKQLLQVVIFKAVELLGQESVKMYVDALIETTASAGSKIILLLFSNQSEHALNGMKFPSWQKKGQQTNSSKLSKGVAFPEKSYGIFFLFAARMKNFSFGCFWNQTLWAWLLYRNKDRKKKGLCSSLR